MLFKPYHLPMIRSGSKTVTRREWDDDYHGPNVGTIVAAKTELLKPDDACDCFIEIAAKRREPLGETTDESARREGDYDDVEDFRAGYEQVYGEGSWDPDKVVTVVEFEYVGDERPDDWTTYVDAPPRSIFGNVLIDGADGQCAYYHRGIDVRCPNDAVAHTFVSNGGPAKRVEMCAEHAREDVPEPPTTEQTTLATDGGRDTADRGWPCHCGGDHPEWEYHSDDGCGDTAQAMAFVGGGEWYPDLGGESGAE